MARTTSPAPYDASPAAKTLSTEVFPVELHFTFFRASSSTPRSVISPSKTGCTKPIASRTRSACMCSVFVVCSKVGRPFSTGFHITSVTSAAFTCPFSPMKRRVSRFQRRVQPSWWDDVVFNIIG